MEETIALAKYITGEKEAEAFYKEFEGRYSPNFDITKDLEKVGVVNQTTQLASDTQAISEYLKATIKAHYQLTDDTIATRFADTRDTLCYATSDNQTAVKGMLDTEANLAIVIGGYNSSNSSHLVELCEQKLPTYFIDSPDRLLSKTTIEHRNWNTKELHTLQNYLPEQNEIKILITSGASCPDAVVEAVIQKIASFYNVQDQVDFVNVIKNM
jgi:4-hydroxy-3-methylbut-2-enyl diphosphate reductase